MAREAWIAAIFFPSAALAGWLATPVMMIAAGTLGLGFLFSQAMILEEAKGIPAWRTPRIVPLIFITGLAEGAGLFLSVTALLPWLSQTAQMTAASAAALAALRAWAWRSYLGDLAKGGAPTRSLAVIDALRPWFFVLGLAAPSVLIAVGFVAAAAQTPLFLLAGVGIFAAGAALKFVLVTRAAYNQGFALAHAPVRGSGVAGPSVKPGWSRPWKHRKRSLEIEP
jgi:phenylacetyl-CoA:acceptor oxidoreductase subunit 2